MENYEEYNQLLKSEDAPPVAVEKEPEYNIKEKNSVNIIDYKNYYINNFKNINNNMIEFIINSDLIPLNIPKIENLVQSNKEELLEILKFINENCLLLIEKKKEKIEFLKYQIKSLEKLKCLKICDKNEDKNNINTNNINDSDDLFNLNYNGNNNMINDNIRNNNIINIHDNENYNNEDGIEETIKCTECQKIFKSIESMTLHYYDIHEKARIQEKEEKEKKEKEEKEKKEKEEKEKIEKEENEKKELGSFINFQQQANQKNSNIINNKNNQKSKKKKKNNIYYQCEFDKKTFTNENSYLNHFFSKHPNYKPYYCSVCSKGFNSYSALEAHCFTKNHYGS